MVMGSEQNRFPQQERRKRWGGCFGAFSCFNKQKGGKRIVPASRMPEGNASTAQPNGQQATGMANQATAFAPSLLAPPSSPASFSNSALPSTAQSPSCFLSLSANSPGGPSNAMYATGPYAHETQLVSPPVFSTYTTEPSTAPLTPPPELAHLTTPSSPDVPFARFLTSSADLKTSDKKFDLQTYSLYPGSPASGLRSPISRTSGEGLSSPFTEREFPPQWDPNGTSMVSPDTNFFCPATFAQFYLDQTPHATGRLSVSKDSDVYPTTNGHQNRQTKTPKQDVEEPEAYRASFGFSADEVITTSQYVEITNVMDDSFSIAPIPTGKTANEDGNASAPSGSCAGIEDYNARTAGGNVSGSSTPGSRAMTDEEDIFSKMNKSRSKKYHPGSSCSDAEIDYRRGRSLREGRGVFAWHD